MNAMEEKILYKDALETGLLNGEPCYRKLDSVIRSMEEETAMAGKLLRGVLRIAIPAAALLVAGTAVAAGILLTGTGSKIRFFSETDSPAIQAQQDYYERHSDAIDDKALDVQGNTVLSLENIAIHKERVTVFYNAQGQVAITLSVNGGEEREPIGVEQADSGAGRSRMASFMVFPDVPQDCTLTVRFYGEQGKLISAMTYPVDLSHSEEEETLILSGKTICIQGTYSEEPDQPPYRPYHDHAVTVDSVRIDRDGGHIILSETIPLQGPYTDAAYAAWAQRRAAAKEAYIAQNPGSTDLEWEKNGLAAFLGVDPCPLTFEEINRLQSAYDEANPVSWDPFLNFSVTDENGDSLMPQLEGFTGSSGQGLALNEIAFTPRAGMKTIRLTPLYYTGEQEIVRAIFEHEAGEDPQDQKLEIVSYSVDQQTRTVTVSYRTTGIRILDSYAEFLLDRQGERIYPEAMYEETHFMDASTGTVTTKIIITDTEWDMSQIGGYGQEWSVPYPDEENSVTIYLDQ